MMDLAAKMLDVQAEDKMQMLTIRGFTNSEEKIELEDEDKSLINSLVQSNLTQLIELNLSDTKTWWSDTEATEHL